MNLPVTVYVIKLVLQNLVLWCTWLSVYDMHQKDGAPRGFVNRARERFRASTLGWCAQRSQRLPLTAISFQNTHHQGTLFP